MAIEHTEFFLIGAIGMGLGTLAFLRAFVTDPQNRVYHLLLVGISGIAFVAYVLMSQNIGTVVAANGHPVSVTRYVDWVLTTPLIIAYLGLLAGVSRRFMGVLIALDLVMIGAGLTAALTTGIVHWAAFAVGLVSFLPLVWGLVSAIRNAVSSQPPAVRALFGKLRNLTVVMWTFYPVAWVLGVTGVGVIDYSVELLLITYADLIAKVGFGVIALNSQRALSQLPRLDVVGVMTGG